MRISDWSSDVCSSDLQRRDAPADPVGQRGAADLDALPREDLRLTVKRKVIAVFVDEHIRDQCLGWQAAGHHMCRCRRLVHAVGAAAAGIRSEEHTSELQSLMRSSYAVFCLKKKNTKINSSHSYITFTHKY